ncbi:hypothetical protein JOQ06_020514 [Pogonophryne albipinna]|uniref:Uncharacterized protein n=1 Tax=Pogonophryne albipinna TaxID=1090488 RepID=A0AAD6FWU5_9TELE|nr:hypothetical protein JOQ06_020514 [Pogonophryne albipinna]
MAGEVDIFTFLKRRNIPDNIVHQLKDDKIDINVINVMTDEELGKYIERYGGPTCTPSLLSANNGDKRNNC